jgi:multidrug transporter EmrE-like cation transporter
MSKLGLILVVLAALTTSISNLMLQSGVLRAGGFATSDRGLLADLGRLALEPLFVTGVLFYLIAALIWFRVLSTEDLASGYVILVGLTFVLVTVGSVLFFDETLSVTKLVGFIVILGGIILLANA